MNKLVRVLLAVMMLSSCQKFRSRFSEITHQCGLEVQAGTVVQVLSPEGQTLATTPENVKAHWLAAEGQTESIALNPRGCALLPREAGVLEVSARLPAGALRHAFSQDEDLRFERLKLIPSPGLAIQSRCQDEIIYASNSLFFPFSFSKTGDFSNVEISLLAHARPGAHAEVIWQKPFYQGEFTFPEQLDVSRLQEGSYDVQLHWRELATSDHPAVSSSCKLSIKRKTPVVSGMALASRLEPRAVAQNTIMPWSSDNPEDTLWLCRRELQRELSELPADDCKNPENYQAVQLIVADKSGLWQYCLVAEDKAGNRSAPHCEQLVVSPAGPQLRVEWLDPDVKERLPLLKRPYANLQARIHLSHPVLKGEALQKTLQCKVDFAIGADIHAAGRSVRCAAGACAGLDLSEFRPCSSELMLDLTAMWAEALQRRSRLTLLVRADDGAGQVSEAEATMWIHDQAWYAEPMARGGSGPEDDEDPQGVALDSKGRAWLLTHSQEQGRHRIYRLETQQWRLALEPSGSRVELQDNGRGGLYLVGTGLGDNTVLHRLGNDDSWSLVPPPYEDFQGSCLAFSDRSREGLVCPTDTTLYFWQDESWSTLDRPSEGAASLCSDFDQTVIVDEDRVWAPCKGKMYLYAAGQWQRKPTPEIDVIESARMDGQGRLWVQTLFPFYENNGIGYFTRDGSWQPTGVDRGLPASLLGQRTLAFGKDARIYYGPFVWNEETFHWDFISSGGLPSFELTAETVQGVKDQAWMAIHSQTSFVELGPKRPIVWHLPSEHMRFAGSDVSFRDQNQQLWWLLTDTRNDRPNLFHLRDSNVLVWDEAHFGMNIQGDWFLNDMKMDAAGQLWLLRSGRLYRYEKGLWRFQTSFSAPVPAHLLPTPSGRLFLGAAGALYEWTPEGPVLLHADSTRQHYFSQVAEDAEGAVWFRMDSSVESDVYRLQAGKLEQIFVDESGSLDSYLMARILTAGGRLLMVAGSSIWGFDKTRQSFVSVDPTDLSLPVGLPYEVHALDLNDTVVAAYEPDVGPQKYVLLSRQDESRRTLPLLPGNRDAHAFKRDIDGKIWAIDHAGEYVFRLAADQDWETILGPAEIKDRLQLDSLSVSSMIPTAEGALFLMQYNAPLLRLLP